MFSRRVTQKLFVVGVAVAALIVGPARGEGPCSGAESKLSEAFSTLERGDVAGAERAFSAIQASHAQCPGVLLGLGRVKAARRDDQAAYQLLSQYLQVAPADARGMVAMAELALSSGNPAQADTLSARAVEADPNSVAALLLRGRILGMKGEATQSEKLLTRAGELAPDNPEPHFELGMLYDRRQQNARAAEQFERVIKLSPSNPRAYDYLALSLEPLGKFEEAELAYKRGLELNSGPLFDAYLDYNYGRFLMKLNRLDEAATHLDRALKLTPDTRAIHYERAKLFEKLGQYDQAREHAEKALQLKDPAGVILDLQVHYQLARIYTRLGEKELAAKYTKLAESSSVPIKSRMRGGR